MVAKREREREPRKTPAEGGKTNEKRKQTGKMKTNPPPERKLTTPKQSLRERESERLEERTALVCIALWWKCVQQADKNFPCKLRKNL